MWALGKLAQTRFPAQGAAALSSLASAPHKRSLGLLALLAAPVVGLAGWVLSDKDRAVLAVALPTRFFRVVGAAATIVLGKLPIRFLQLGTVYDHTKYKKLQSYHRSHPTLKVAARRL